MAERVPRTGRRIRAEEPVARALVVATLVVFGALPFLAAASALSKGWQASGDDALIALRSRDAWTSHAPLVGHPTTADRFTGIPSNNPGPIEYWVLGATSRAFGAQAGLVLGIAAIEAASLVGILWLAHRRGGTELLALTAVALAGLVLVLGVPSLWDPFNSEVSTYPMLLAVFAAWSVVTGDLRVAAVLVPAASVAGQVHVAGAAFVAPLLVAAAASLVVVWRRHPATVRRERRWLLGALGLLVVLWLPPLLYEVGSEPSNVSALWRTSTIDRPRIGLAWMLERLMAAVAPIPAFLHRGSFVEDASALQVVLAALIIGGVGSLALLLRDRRRRSPIPWLAALVLLPMATSLWVGSRQPPLSAFRADGTRWLWVTSLATWVALAWEARALAPAASPAVRDRVAPAVGVAVAGLALVVGLASFHLTDVRDGELMAAIDRVGSATSGQLPKGTYRLEMEGEQALLSVGPALAYRLESDGYRIRVDDNAFGRAFGPQRAVGGEGLPTLRVASTSDAARPKAGERQVASVPIDPDDPSAGTIEVFTAR